MKECAIENGIYSLQTSMLSRISAALIAIFWYENVFFDLDLRRTRCGGPKSGFLVSAHTFLPAFAGNYSIT
jgi:hypothetical protein